MKALNELSIFVVDDDPFYLNLLKQQLLGIGLTSISTFSNGADCLNKLHEKPDVIFLDYNMDDLSGYDVLKKIKRYDPDMVVVMVSAQNKIKPAVDALKHGAFEYLEKESHDVQKLAEVLIRIHSFLEITERSKPSLVKKIFQYL